MYDAGFENAMILGGVHVHGMTEADLAWLAKFPHLQLDKAQVNSDLVNQFTGIKQHDKATQKNKALVFKSSFEEPEDREEPKEPPETPLKNKLVEFYSRADIGTKEFWNGELEDYLKMSSSGVTTKQHKKHSPLSAKEELMCAKVELERADAECNALKSETAALGMQLQAITKIVCQKGEELAIEKKEFKAFRQTAMDTAATHTLEMHQLKAGLAKMQAEAKIAKTNFLITEKFIQYLAFHGGQTMAPDGGIFLNRHAIGYNSMYLNKHWRRLGAVMESWENDALPIWKIPMGIAVRPFMEWVIV